MDDIWVNITVSAFDNLIYGAYFGTGINAVIYRKALGDPQWAAHCSVACVSVLLGLIGGGMCRSFLYTSQSKVRESESGGAAADRASDKITASEDQSEQTTTEKGEDAEWDFWCVHSDI